MTTDIALTSFWDKTPRLKPYALLARWDRPVGFWLTLWPTLWSLFLAPVFKTLPVLQQVYCITLLAAGAFLVRGAGCTVNDILDRKLDARVARTKTRPLASGSISVRQAVIFLLLQLGAAAVILFQLSPLAILLGFATLPLIALYPLMKCIIWWPQAFLGIVFNAGALIAWAALENSLGVVPWLLYCAAFCWTMAYDTVYAHMDAEDDRQIGVKSTALKWGANSKTYILCFWLAALALFFAALYLGPQHAMGLNAMGLLAFSAAAVILLLAHIFWEPANRRYSLAFFRLQSWIGLLLALAALAPVVF